MDWILIFAIISGVVAGLFLIMDMHKKRKEFKTEAKKYQVSKFPVVSKTDNVYFAEIAYCKDSFRTWIECSIYERIFKSEIKYKDKIIENKKIDFESFDYNFKNVVIAIIGEYEQEHMKEIKKKKHMEEALICNKELFNKWDGII